MSMLPDQAIKQATRVAARAAVTALAFVGVLAIARSAAAQPGTYYPPPPPPGQPYGYGYQPPPPPGPQRDGLTLGLGIGGGAISCEECDDALEGVALEFHIGGMLTPQLALMFDASIIIHEIENSNGASIQQYVNVGAVQFWITPRFWLKGGLGLGRLSVTDEEGYAVFESETGGAILAGGGVELYQNSSFALDLQLRFAAVNYEDAETLTNTSLLIGVNWY